MKKLLFLISMCSAAQAYGQQCRVLENADGNLKSVIYFADTRDYYLCGGPTTPRRKIASGERLLDQICDCNSGGPTRGPSPIVPIIPGAAYSNIQFDFDSSVLPSSSYPALTAIATDLKTSESSIEVEGFASSEGTAAHNIALSKDRANSVKTYLVNAGVDAKKVKVKGFGETNPIADNSTEEGRSLNRRVQFKKQ